jgi:hypothetical protein
MKGEIMSTAKERKRKVEPATANFYFPKKAKVQPQKFTDLEINDVITVTVTGKVKSLSMHDDGDYANKDFRLNITKMVIGKKMEDNSVSYST